MRVPNLAPIAVPLPTHHLSAPLFNCESILGRIVSRVPAWTAPTFEVVVTPEYGLNRRFSLAVRRAQILAKRDARVVAAKHAFNVALQPLLPKRFTADAIPPYHADCFAGKSVLELCWEMCERVPKLTRRIAILTEMVRTLPPGKYRNEVQDELEDKKLGVKVAYRCLQDRAAGIEAYQLALQAGLDLQEAVHAGRIAEAISIGPYNPPRFLPLPESRDCYFGWDGEYAGPINGWESSKKSDCGLRVPVSRKGHHLGGFWCGVAQSSLCQECKKEKKRAKTAPALKPVREAKSFDSLYGELIEKSRKEDEGRKRVVRDRVGDVAWAERQSAFPHSDSMPRLHRHFCPDCVEVAGPRKTKGVYLEKEHDCGVRVLNLAGELLEKVSLADFEARPMETHEGVQPDKTAAPVVTFKAARSVEWRRTHSPMAKLMWLFVSVHDAKGCGD